MSNSSSTLQPCYLTNGSRVVDLRGNCVRIGRAEDCDLRVTDNRTSRHHCEIFERDGAYFIRDLGSTNGTFVNGAAITYRRLQPGDVISVAGESFIVDSQRREIWERLVRFTQLFSKLRGHSAASAAVSGSI